MTGGVHDEKLAGTNYKPYTSKNGTVPREHFSKAFSEFARRFGRSRMSRVRGGETNSSPPSVLLVASGVSKNWVPGDDVGSGRFLLFSNLDGALFVT